MFLYSFQWRLEVTFIYEQSDKTRYSDKTFKYASQWCLINLLFRIIKLAVEQSIGPLQQFCLDIFALEQRL